MVMLSRGFRGLTIQRLAKKLNYAVGRCTVLARRTPARRAAAAGHGSHRGMAGARVSIASALRLPRPGCRQHTADDDEAARRWSATSTSASRSDDRPNTA
jgi:hypothetical protein